jgi:quercetin 2,3-dioxygenase
MKLKTINQKIRAEKVNMGGNYVYQPLPMSNIDQVDPFLLIHHWVDELPGGQSQRSVGVGPHPHRGFSPVTFIFEGNIQHRDSLGNDAIVNEGGTQWMHAGRGITHSERPSAEVAENGGKLEFIQFWVNSPASAKMEAPYYLPVSEQDTPKIEFNGGFIAVVAGSFEGLKGPAKTQSPMILLRGELEEGSKRQISLPSNHNVVTYFLDGKMIANGLQADSKNMLSFNQDGEGIELEAIEKTRFIILSGEPLKESVASYGPFVMNNQTEIMQALRDSQMGKMGILIEEFD